MQKLDGHWVAKRVGILEHYKSMTLTEIVLFDAYLLLANKQTWECWRTVRQLEEILPMKKDSILRAKKKLVKRGWIQEINRTGIFIPKLYRYSSEKAADDPLAAVTAQAGRLSHLGERLSRSGEHPYRTDEGSLSHLGEQKFPQERHLSHLGERKVAFGGTIIEEGSIIEDDYLLSRSEKSEISGLCQLAKEDRLYLNLLKSIPGYPFNFEKDLSFLRDLLVDFPTLDFQEEIKAWKTWLLDKNLKGKINYRSRFRKWLQNSVNFKKGEANEKYTCTKSGRQGSGSTKPEARGLRPGRAYAPEGEKKGRKGFDLPSAYPIDAGGA
ncbi:MAG: helix-turn-helix domain-containing protein [Deltaproteobacteria bacterium]|nr:helix-turn-helix domain-containing protein [Deltaproteobacteria bacterium]